MHNNAVRLNSVTIVNGTDWGGELGGDIGGDN